MVLTATTFALPGAAHASDVTVVVKDDRGRPVKDAVVILNGPARNPPAPGHFVITQKDMTFLPFVLVVPVGSTVDFGNLDPFRHHVYSFSPAKKFELKLFGQGQTRPVKFDKVGVVAIGCNIHDTMQAFVQVVDTPFAVKTGANGRVLLKGMPDGAQSIRVWHPQLRAPANQVIIPVNAKGAVTLPVTVKLRAPAPKSDY
jgi:plastocyanin